MLYTSMETKGVVMLTLRTGYTYSEPKPSLFKYVITGPNPAQFADYSIRLFSPLA